MKSLAEGDAFGDYRVVCRLGKGGMSEVRLLRFSTVLELLRESLPTLMKV